MSSHIINVFPSIIVFLYRYLSSDNNPLFIISKFTEADRRARVCTSNAPAHMCTLGLLVLILKLKKLLCMNNIKSFIVQWNLS